ncbi:hypothetical protein NM688_g5345 [Phlebia brevispora]|uniref:Uncharacterized protein n=1 Tax=Phlebia brevispora TaxID=194682 RepID=A0ACC1SWM0_9APHY|nr:hypothetical protein NM688_g5345 [Phlebia brevispora]
MPTATESATIEGLSARIAALEQALLSKDGHDTSQKQNPCHSDEYSPPETSSRTGESTESTATDPDSPKSFEAVTSQNENGPRALLDFNVQVAAVALAQLSMAPRTEYVGAGTVLCALHKVSFHAIEPSDTFPYFELFGPTSVTTGGPSDPLHPLVSPIRSLLTNLPSRPEMEELLRGFFIERNWQFGISEQWFRAAMEAMWKHLSLRCTPTCRAQGGCAACREEINPHWLCLLFSILALAPASGQAAKESAKYFMTALTAKRIVEDFLLASPVYSTSEKAVNGGVLSCIAAVFLAIYQSDRGRLSESWKLVGAALRSAQALGLHRDPSWRKWQTMHKIEIELRVTAWWLLVTSDRLYSFLLGRPAMVPEGSFDVSALPTDVHGDGSPNEHGLFVQSYIALGQLISEAAEKCLGINTPPYATVLQMDHRLEEWEAQLHPRMRWRLPQPPPTIVYEHPQSLDNPDGPPCPERKHAYQRHTLAGWYLSTLMNIHRPYLMHPPVLPKADTASASNKRSTLNPSRERCIQIAMELTRLMTNFHDEGRAWPLPGGLNTATIAYFVFDGAVALAGALSQVPPHPQSMECLALLDKSLRVMKELADSTDGATDGQGEMPRRAITILTALRRAGGWDMTDEEKGELVILQDMLSKQHSQRQQQQQWQQQPEQGAEPINRTKDEVSNGVNFSSIPQQRSAQYQRSNTAFGVQSNSASASPYVPFPNTHPSLPEDLFAPNQPSSSTMASGSTYSGIPSFSGYDVSYAGISSPSPFYTGQSRPVQSMVMPFDVLQGVQPDVQETANIDLNWARLAGMESWYSNGAAPSLDGNIIP